MIRAPHFLFAVMTLPRLAAAEGDAPPPSLARALKAAAPEVQLAAAKPKPPAGSPSQPGRPQPTKIGEHRLLTAGQLAKGAWLKAGAGESSIWRLTVRSKGAAAMRLHFQNFHILAGKVWVHNGKDWFGPYAGDGMYGDGDFWSHVVPGERLTIEYEPPAGEAPKPLPFKVQSVSHLTLNPFDSPGAR